MPRILAAALLASLALGCSEAFLSITRYRSQEALTDEGYRTYRARRGSHEPGATGQPASLTKADVLAVLGPPIRVIGQGGGDVFVYQRLARDTFIVNVNPSFVPYFGPAPPIPLYFGSFSEGRNDVMMVFFDAEGRVVADGERFQLGRPQ